MSTGVTAINISLLFIFLLTYDLFLSWCFVFCPQNWLQSNAKMAADTELKDTITPGLFEGVFDLLEKNTGFSDPIPLVHPHDCFSPPPSLNLSPLFQCVSILK